MPFLTESPDKKKLMVQRTNDREQEKVPTPGSSQWWVKLACTKAAWVFRKLVEWEQKISLMPSILLDKNCTQQNGILGEPRKIGNGLYIWQLSSEEGKLGSCTAAWICALVAEQ